MPARVDLELRGRSAQNACGFLLFRFATQRGDAAEWRWNLLTVYLPLAERKST
jgi:hypothetical protein